MSRFTRRILLAFVPALAVAAMAAAPTMASAQTWQAEGHAYTGEVISAGTSNFELDSAAGKVTCNNSAESSSLLDSGTLTASGGESTLLFRNCSSEALCPAGAHEVTATPAEVGLELTGLTSVNVTLENTVLLICGEEEEKVAALVIAEGTIHGSISGNVLSFDNASGLSLAGLFPATITGSDEQTTPGGEPITVA